MKTLFKQLYITSDILLAMLDQIFSYSWMGGHEKRVKERNKSAYLLTLRG